MIDAELSGSLDEYVAFVQANAELPRPLHLSAWYRWSSRRGCRGVRLRYVQIGQTRYTTRRWIREFFDALTAASKGEVTSAAPTAQSETRRRSAEKANAALELMGV